MSHTRGEYQFFAYPLLVSNPMGYDLTLERVEEFESSFFGEKDFTIYLSTDNGKKIYTYVDEDYTCLIGERVYFTFDGVVKRDEVDFEEIKKEEKNKKC